MSSGGKKKDREYYQRKRSFYKVKRVSHEEDIKNINRYVSNNRASKYMKQKLTHQRNRQMHNHRDFNIFL